MLLEILLVIPGLFHLTSGQGERTSLQSATPDPLEELFGIGLDKNIDPWSSNLIFGDIKQNEFSNSVVTTPPPLPSNNNQERSRQESLPSGLSFLNGGGSLPGFPVLDTIPPVDQASTGENGLFNIPPMPNFDQLGLENVLDKFLPIDGSIRLPPPSDNPIIHSRENSPIPSIDQLGIDGNGLFGESLFSPSAGSLSNTPATSSGSINNLLTNNNNNNNQMGLVDIPSESTSLNQGNLGQNLASSPSERSTEQKAIDQRIWDGILPPLPKDPVEIFPTNKPTPKPKTSEKNPKKKKFLLPLLPPSPTRKSTKNKAKQISSDRLLDTIPRVNQLITTTTSRPININNKNLLENIPSIDQLGIIGSSSPTKNTMLSDNNQKTQDKVTEQTSIIGDIFQFPDQFNGGNRQSSSLTKDKPKDSMRPSQTQASDSFSTDSEKNATTLEEIWKNILIEIPELGKLTGEEAPKERPKSIDELLGFSVHDIESFNANQTNTLQPDKTKPKVIPQNTTPKPFLPVILRTTSPTVYVPPTTLSPRIFITPSITPLPPLKVNIPLTTTLSATPPPLPPLNVYTPPTTLPPPQPPTTSTPEPPITTEKDIYSLPTNPTMPPKVYVPPTLASPEKIATPQKHITIDFKKKDQNTFESPGSNIKDEGAPPPLSGELLPTLDLPQFTDFSKTVSTTKNPPLELPSELASTFTTPFSINNFVPTIPDEKFKQPDIIDVGIFNNNNERNPFTETISEEPWLPQVKQNIPGSSTGEQATQKQSQVFGWDALFPDNQETVLENPSNEKQNQRTVDIFSKTKEKFQQVKFADGKDTTSNSQSVIESYLPTTTEESPLPGLEMLLGKNEVMPTTTSIPELPPLNFDLLDSMTKDGMNQEEARTTVNGERGKIIIKNQNIKDFPPLDIDILQGFQDIKETVTTPPPPNPTLPSLPFFGDLNTLNTDRQEPWDITSRDETFNSRDTRLFSTLPPATPNEDPLQRNIESNPLHTVHASENSRTNSRSRERTNELPFIGPTSEASKHFDFEPHNGGNIRPHPLPLSHSTTLRTPITNEKPTKPNILVIDIVNKPSDEIDTTTRQSRPVFQNANNLANIRQVSNLNNNGIIPQGTGQTLETNRLNSQVLQQVTPTPQRGTTPAWLMSTLFAIRARLNQLRALRNNRQNNGNNNSQNPVINRPTNQNSNQRHPVINRLTNQNTNQRQIFSLPSQLDLNNQRNNGQLIQNQPQLQNGNLRNVNIQRPVANGVLFQGNLNNLPFSNRGLSQSQPLANFQNMLSRNSQQQRRTPLQIPSIPNRSNQPNLQIRQSVFQPSVQQTQSSGIQNTQTQQSGATEAETDLLRERIRQRIQQVLRTQILRQLLARRLQALRSQSNNNAQQSTNQPIRRIPTSTNNMNIMNANNAINIIRQARQRALAASQQQQQQQQQWPNQQFNNIFRRFSNRNLQTVGFAPNSFGRQQTAQPLDLSRLFRNNRGLNLNNRFGQSIQQMVSNETNGNRMNRDQRLDLSQPPSERALQTLRNFNLQRTRGVHQGFSWQNEQL
ncbi:mucin-2-like isoform X2 [Saccostrea echinata]|uniref:mucin-2-like isoform X2 n=1 Tax=Saccostrea echinata TaxID=191078 RepID=UPI002A83AF1A|nr:mucin-2-like isoform X2 [Saccostrea echinata]